MEEFEEFDEDGLVDSDDDDNSWKVRRAALKARSGTATPAHTHQSWPVLTSFGRITLRSLKQWSKVCQTGLNLIANAHA